MLNPLRNDPVVVKTAEELGKMFVRSVKGQLREGHGSDVTFCGWFELFCLLLEKMSGYAWHHVQWVVKVLRASSHRGEGRHRSEGRHTGGREG